MGAERLFWICLVIASFFLGSAYVSQHLRKSSMSVTVFPPSVTVPATTPQTEKHLAPVNPSENVVAEADLGAAPNMAGTVAHKASDQDAVKVPVVDPTCKIQDEYLLKKRALGDIVNVREMREHHVPEFLKEVENYRAQFGLPLPIQITSTRLSAEKVVFNNCKPSCKGLVYQVYTKGLKDLGHLDVLLQDGSFKTMALHQSGLELASLDELNAQGVPFRSWLAPFSNGDWFIQGLYFFYRMDIEGLWIRIDTKGQWTVVANPQGLTKLNAIDPLKVPGCRPEEQCLEALDAGRQRHFKAPQVCVN